MLTLFRLAVLAVALLGFVWLLSQLGDLLAPLAKGLGS